jgi:dsDNA-binding SOS-regulon protein
MAVNMLRIKEVLQGELSKGISQYYTAETEAEKYKRMLEYERKASERYRNQAQSAENQARTLKGHLTRKKKQLARVHNGVCPCCNRTFQNLLRHMETKHPEYKKR